MPLVQNWWCEDMNKLVEREAFIDSVQIEGAHLKIHSIFSSRRPVQKSRSGGTPRSIQKVHRKIDKQAQKPILLALLARGCKLEGSDKQATRKNLRALCLLELLPCTCLKKAINN